MADTPPTLSLRCPACGTWATNAEYSVEVVEGLPCEGPDGKLYRTQHSRYDPPRKRVRLDPCNHWLDVIRDADGAAVVRGRGQTVGDGAELYVG